MFKTNAVCEKFYPGVRLLWGLQSKRNGFVIFINKYEQHLRNFDCCFTKEAIGQSDVVIKTWVKY
jgi:hypothetical protein